jgi:asparagine synthase (glutamine-hydrolysing)
VPSATTSVAAAAPYSALPWVAVTTRTPGVSPEYDLVSAEMSALQYSTPRDRCVVIFEGVLHNRMELAQQLGMRTSNLDAAEVLSAAYQRWGLDLPEHLDGSWSLIIVDGREGRIVAVRDPLGSRPLFYAEVSGQLMFSISIDALRQRPGVDGALNRAALVDHLCHNWTDPGDTFFAKIRRVPRGHVLVADARTTMVTRYWQPVKEGQPVDWVREEDLQPQFESYFERAVSRALTEGPTGIFLSGGLDSISVTAMATDVAKRDGHQLPRPYSLGFPGEANEEKEQRGVAAKLGLDHTFVPFNDVVPAGGLLPAALGMTERQPAPLLNTWQPAYVELARRAQLQGIRTILSGAGGDEWLSVTPIIAADMIKRGDFGSLGRLIVGWQNSYKLNVFQTLHQLLWKYGLSPVLAGVADQYAPRAYHRNRVRRTMTSLGTWGVPDATLRGEVAARIERWLPEVNPPLGLYFRDTVNMVEHPLTAMEGEETFHIGHKLGVRYRHPYWDPAVAGILYRTPPLLLFQGGFSKSVVRNTMARRFPGLGLEHQKKRAATLFMSLVLNKELPGLWSRNKDLTALGDLRVVEPRAAIAQADRNLKSGTVRGFGRTWELMNVETWVRAHQ